MSQGENQSSGRRVSRRAGLGHGEGRANSEGNQERDGQNEEEQRQSGSSTRHRRRETRREEERQESREREQRTERTVGTETTVEGSRRSSPGNLDSDAVLRALYELLTGALQRQAGTSDRTGSYTVSDFLKLVTAMRNLGTTKFKGEPNPIEADEWMEMMEVNFKATRCPDEYKKTIAVYYLEKEALAWWQSTERQFEEEVTSWAVFKSEFLRKYFPQEARDRLERRFLTLYQGGWTVRQYEAEFVRLRRYVYRGMDDESAMMRYFLQGLRPELSSRLAVVDFSSLNRMIERAVNVEERLNLLNKPGDRGSNMSASRSGKTRTDFNRGQSGSQNSGRASNQWRTQSSRSERTVSTGLCYTCNQPGHVARNCPNIGARSESRKRERAAPEYVTCYACGDRGHYATSCPHRPTTTATATNRSRVTQPRAELDAGKKTVDTRVYALDVDKPGPSDSKKGPISGM